MGQLGNDCTRTVRKNGSGAGRQARRATASLPYIGFEEKKKGSIEAGKLADVAILTADFLTVPEDQIMSIKSYMTVVDGRVVYEAQPAR